MPAYSDCGGGVDCSAWPSRLALVTSALTFGCSDRGLGAARPGDGQLEAPRADFDAGPLRGGVQSGLGWGDCPGRPLHAGVSILCFRDVAALSTGRASARTC